MSAIVRTFTSGTPDAPWFREASAQLFIDAAETQSVALAVHDRLITRAAEMALPVLDEPPAAGWYAEDAEIAATAADMRQVVTRPAKVAVLATFSREALADDATGRISAADVVAAGVASKVDEAFFGDLAAPAPSGLGSLTVNAVDYDPATGLDGFYAAAAHAETRGTRVGAFVLSPADWAALSTLKKATGSAEPLLSSTMEAPRRTIAGGDVFVSSQVPTGTAWALPRDAARIVVREDVNVIVDPSRYLEFDRVAVRVTMRVGFAFVRPSAISLITPAV